MSQDPRVLSVQSHVVSGYVGNKSATFPLQLLGFDVDAINSVQFSNHTGYEHFAGQVLTDKDLGQLAENLSLNNLDFYSHLLTGYVGSPSFLNRIAELIRHLRQVNPKLVYVCDPVMGDNGKMYVPAELLPIYRNVIVPLADVVTPNQFEVELLTQRKITSIAEAWEAVEVLHEAGCKTVVLSSSELGGESYLLGLASSKEGGQTKRLKIEIPKLKNSFTGTGDLFAALFLAWMHRSNNDLKEALEKTIASLQAVLKRTLLHANAVGVSVKTLELKLIQSKQDIEEPEVTVLAQEAESCTCCLSNKNRSLPK